MSDEINQGYLDSIYSWDWRINKLTLAAKRGMFTNTQQQLLLLDRGQPVLPPELELMTESVNKTR